MRILGIETSCDETGIAIYDEAKGLLAHHLYSQVEIHAEYGGVVPELASRDHVRKILPLISAVLKDAGVGAQQIDGIAYTSGPGLIGALLVGASIGKSLAYAWQVPAVAIHHMEGHLLAPMLEEDPPQFPFVALLVSGGHTMLVDVRGIGEYTILGESVDDAAGEAFDKTAKILNLGYPGGPQIAASAAKGQPGRFTFPRPMVDRPGLDMSFSGLKTAVANTIAKADKDEQTRADIAYAFQDAVCQTLTIKCKRALEETGHSRLVIAGGVSANTELRRQLSAMLKQRNGQIYYPRLAFCTDNGAMIAYAGMHRLKAQQSTELNNLSIEVKPRWPIDQLTALTTG